LPANYHTLGTNQYIAIIHTQISSSSGGDGIELAFTQDNHYCSYFANHPSSWQLWLSDPLREQLAASHLEGSIDNKVAKITAADFRQETLTIDLPPGVGSHTWKLEAEKNKKEP
jgi:hypothetical protein